MRSKNQAGVNLVGDLSVFFHWMVPIKQFSC